MGFWTGEIGRTMVHTRIKNLRLKHHFMSYGYEEKWGGQLIIDNTLYKCWIIFPLFLRGNMDFTRTRILRKQNSAPCLDLQARRRVRSWDGTYEVDPTKNWRGPHGGGGLDGDSVRRLYGKLFYPRVRTISESAFEEGERERQREREYEIFCLSSLNFYIVEKCVSF